MVRQALDAVCETFDGCETLAYADLSTNLVLATNTTTRETQDSLNTLCAEATLLLDGGGVAVVGTQSGFRIFLRDGDTSTDGLIGLCNLTSDVARLVPAAQRCLAQIASGD
ncbi:hypothetical protein [Marivita hallyeonensis]|uniref:Roadblock/LAMTOR2 domain-containing protein n=1 Tax=Marivita hallyeonensis TaxID=996342 RepID=A0A1M5LQQ0_9RHOB|nr:hypothetical protein [Marivita hallyeonensis]SHG67345.1 hypothetical protein SAMN05443551_0246 [Marivita hallyeonensis]